MTEQTIKTRGRPKKVLMTDAHRDSLMRTAKETVELVQSAKRVGYYEGYDDGLVNGYKSGVEAGIAYYKETKEDDFSFFGTFFATLGVGFVVIGLWWIVSGQL
jgi:hypothetical protein